VAIVLLLGAAGTALADIPDQVRAKCQEIDQKIQELLQLKGELLKVSGVPAPTPAPAKSAWAEKVKINGYFQNRFENQSWADPEDQFLVRRMYINLIVTPNNRTQAVITWSRIGANPYDTSWDYIFADYKLTPEDTIRFGQGPTSFGLETAQSSSARLALERAAVLEGGTGRGKPNGVYAQGDADKGLWYIHTPADCTASPQVTLGILNGQFREVEADSSKTFAVDLKMMPTWGRYGLSWLDGDWTSSTTTQTADLITGVVKSTTTKSTTDREAICAYLRYDQPTNWAAQGEYVDGKLMGRDITGWYGQLEYEPPATPGTLFAKFERYDPNPTKAPQPAAASVGEYADYQAWILGYAHRLDPNNTLTLQWTDGDWGCQNRDELGFQWQLGF